MQLKFSLGYHKQVKFSKGIFPLRDAIAILSMRLIGSDERATAETLGALEIRELCYDCFF
jgi:hypothetical protein